VNDSALFRPPYKTATVTFNTAQIENFLNSGVTGLSLEIEISDGGKPQTVLSTAVTFNQNDLIVTGSAVPANQAAYLTATEIAAQYVEDSTANVDATNRRLKNSSGTTVVDYEQSLFGNGALDLSGSGVTISSYPLYVNSTLTVGGAVSFGGGMAVSGNLGFFGTSPTAQGSGINIANSITKSGIISFTQPTQANVVSNVISLGLIASSATYGVLPQSLRTLTTVTFFGPVTVGSNDANSTTVALAGVKPNDVCLLGLPINITEGITLFSHCVTDGQVHIDLLNVTGSQKIQTAATYRITVIGY
jgi:hypothetical protein